MKKFSKGSEKAWNSFLGPANNGTIRVIGMALVAKLRKPEVGQEGTTNNLKNIPGRQIFITNRYTWKWTSFKSYVFLLQSKFGK